MLKEDEKKVRCSTIYYTSLDAFTKNNEDIAVADAVKKHFKH